MQNIDYAPKHWIANLSLGFSGRSDKTILAHREHSGPLVVQKPFYPEGNVCHVYILHPPGGIVGGDEIHLSVTIDNQGHALITTPAAAKFYRSDGRIAVLNQRFNIADSSVLEWMPQETILFSGSMARMKTRVDLENAAKFIGWEIVCAGRPACGEIFSHGEVQQHFELWRNHEPLVIDRARFQGGSELLQAAWGMRGFTTTATMLATNCNNELLEYVRSNLIVVENSLLSLTLIDDVLIVRALANQAETVRRHFIAIWQLLRPKLLLKQSSVPRIWAT